MLVTPFAGSSIQKRSNKLTVLSANAVKFDPLQVARDAIKLACNAILDGEVVAADETGRGPHPRASRGLYRLGDL